LKRQGKLPIPGTLIPYNLSLPQRGRVGAERLIYGFMNRLGRYSQDLPLKGTPPPINRLVPPPSLPPLLPSTQLTPPHQVLYARRLRSPPHLSPQNRRRRPSAQSPRQHQEPRVEAFAPCRCVGECGSQGDAGVGGDWGVGEG